MGFVDAVTLLVVDDFVGFACGRWLVVASFLWILLSRVVGFVGSVLQFFSSPLNLRKGREKTQERGEIEDRGHVTVLQTV